MENLNDFLVDILKTKPVIEKDDSSNIIIYFSHFKIKIKSYFLNSKRTIKVYINNFYQGEISDYGIYKEFAEYGDNLYKHIDVKNEIRKMKLNKINKENYEN